MPASCQSRVLISVAIELAPIVMAVELVAERAGVDAGRVDLRHVELARGDGLVERLGRALVDVLEHRAIAHLDHVRHVAAGDLGRELGEVVVEAQRLAFDDDAGVLAVEDLDDREGALVALGIAPPEMADAGASCAKAREPNAEATASEPAAPAVVVRKRLRLEAHFVLPG